MKYLSQVLFIITITVLFGGAPSYGEEPLEIVPLPEIEVPTPKADRLSEELENEAVNADKTPDVYVDPAPTPTPAPSPSPIVQAPISAPRNKLDDSIGREHDLWDPDFLLQPDPEVEDIIDPNKGVLERSYFGISRRVVHLANSVDSIFGDRRATDEYDGSTLRITQEAVVSDTGLGTGDLSLSLNLQLPNLQSMEKRVRQSIAEDIAGGASTENDSAQEEFKKENSSWDFNQESGIRTRWPPSYFSQLRARKNFLTKSVVNHFLFQVGWDSEAEWEQKTQLLSDYAISKSLLFRFLNEANWAMTNHLFGTIHGPSLIQQIDDSSAISYDARILTKWEADNWYINNYTLGSVYRKAILGRRMFIEVHPELSWPKIDDHEFNWNIFVSFELLFGRAS